MAASVAPSPSVPAALLDSVVSFFHPRRVILFGSLVRGTAVPGSDVDLLLVLTASDRSFVDRIPAFLPSHFPVGVDIFPYTRAELERMKAEGNSFVLAALRDGIAVFRRSA